MLPVLHMENVTNQKSFIRQFDHSCAQFRFSCSWEVVEMHEREDDNRILCVVFPCCHLVSKHLVKQYLKSLFLIIIISYEVSFTASCVTCFIREPETIIGDLVILYYHGVIIFSSWTFIKWKNNWYLVVERWTLLETVSHQKCWGSNATWVMQWSTSHLWHAKRNDSLQICGCTNMHAWCAQRFSLMKARINIRFSAQTFLYLQMEYLWDRRFSF